MSHTKQPWELGYGNGITGPRCAPAVWWKDSIARIPIRSGDQVVAWVAEYLGMPFNGGIDEHAGATEEMLADARLIAAAPELLDACKAVAQLRSSIRTWALGNRIPGWQSSDELFASIEAAIAKAEGKDA